jgi:serine/threonine protein kinase
VLKALRSPAPVQQSRELLPHTPEILELGVTDAGLPYAVLEPLSGETLTDRLLRHRAIAPREALAWSRTVSEVVSTAHDQGIVHGFLDPEAVFLQDVARVTPSVLVLGFEMGELLPRHLGADAALVAGLAPPFGAPETRAGAEPAPPADSYGLALLLGTLFRSSPPPPNASLSELRRWATTAVPHPVSGLVTQGLDPQPGRRPAAGDFAEALRTVAQTTRY